MQSIPLKDIVLKRAAEEREARRKHIEAVGNDPIAG